MLGTHHPVMRYNILEEIIPQLQCCKNLKAHIVISMNSTKDKDMVQN
jgi:hypothetical protein